jgi:TldD protein
LAHRWAGTDSENRGRILARRRVATGPVDRVPPRRIAVRIITGIIIVRLPWFSRRRIHDRRHAYDICTILCPSTSVMKRPSARVSTPHAMPSGAHRDVTRRGFLTTVALTAAGASLTVARGQGGPSHGEQSYPLSFVRKHRTLTGASLLPEAMPSESLRTLASAAIDAARAAGASYADVRVSEEHRLGVAMGQNITTQFFFFAGIRVQVNGAWAFMHGIVPTLDTMAMIAQHAVATAKGYAGAYGGNTTLAPASVVSGEWTTPIQLDPFTVPLYDQADAKNALASAIRSRHVSVQTGLAWQRETCVFASTEGAVQTQTFYRAEPLGSIFFTIPRDTEASIGRRVLLPQAAGFECMTAPELPERIKAMAEETLQLASLPLRTLEVGRYPLVMDGSSFGATLLQTVGLALSLPRALGDEIGGAGGSFLSPAVDRVGTVIASPLLTVTADRAAPNDYRAVRWDDEGVAPTPAPLIDKGRLVSYYASRQSAAALAAAAPSLPATAATLGYTSAAPDTGMEMIVPHLTVVPAPFAASVEDLCRDVSRGVLLYQNHERWRSDSMLASGFKSCNRDGNLFEIVNGKVTHRLCRVGLQFATQRWLNGVRALGGVQTVEEAACDERTRWKSQWPKATAPAALFKEIDIVRARFNL